MEGANVAGTNLAGARLIERSSPASRSKPPSSTRRISAGSCGNRMQPWSIGPTSCSRASWTPTPGPNQGCVGSASRSGW
ncbi:MAG: hypothetical protein HZY74_13555 [Brevundimonas sp.]|nr:MAG: hypothetical protein HZY74_13555 [Brevundimonas sp.]